MPHESDTEAGVPLDDLMQGGEAEQFLVIEESYKAKRKTKPTSPRIRWLVIILLVAVIAQTGVIAFLLLQPSQRIQESNSLPVVMMPAINVMTPQSLTMDIEIHMAANPSPSNDEQTIVTAKNVDTNGCPVETTTTFNTSDTIHVIYQGALTINQTIDAQLAMNQFEVFRVNPPMVVPQTYTNACVSFGFNGAQLAQNYGMGTYTAAIYLNRDKPVGQASFTLSN